jgi:hypothetical protein
MERSPEVLDDGPAASLPDNGAVIYGIHDGQHGRKPQRYLVGLFTFRMTVSEGALAGTFEEPVEPERDKRFPGRVHRKSNGASDAVKTLLSNP